MSPEWDMPSFGNSCEQREESSKGQLHNQAMGEPVGIGAYEVGRRSTAVRDQSVYSQ